MGIILALIIISIGSLFGSVVLNKRYEEMLPFSIFSIIISLYLFYILNLLRYGYYFVLFSALILTIFSIYRFFKNKEIRKQAIANFFTPGLLIFAVAVIIIYFITKNNYVMLFDELRLWGAYPKALYSFEKLMFDGSELFSSNYLPGMPLFQYFFAKTVGYFAESHLFLSYAIVGLSMLMPITKKINWKKYWLIIPGIILMIFLPMLFANSGFDCLYYYKTLYIDPMIGFAFGYALYLSTIDFKKDKFSYVLFCLAITMPLLFKLVGLILVLVVIFSYLVHQLFIYKSINIKLKEDLFKLILKLLIPIIGVILIFMTWQLSIKHYNFTGGSSVDSSLKSAVKVVLKPSEEDKIFLDKYINYIKTAKGLVNDNKLSAHYTIINISAFFILVLIIILLLNKKKTILTLIVCVILAVVGSTVFLYFPFSIIFYRSILCYERYMCPIFSGLSFLVLYLVTSINLKEKKLNLYYFLLSILVMAFIFNFPKITEFKYEEKVDKLSNSYANIIKESIPNFSKKPKILTVYKDCNTITYSCVLWQHHLYLELLDENIFATGIFIADEENAKAFLSAQSDTPPEFYVKTAAQNYDYAFEGYDYVFVVEDVENISQNIAKYFGNKIAAGDFYKIITVDGKIKLEKIIYTKD